MRAFLHGPDNPWPNFISLQYPLLVAHGPKKNRRVVAIALHHFF